MITTGSADEDHEMWVKASENQVSGHLVFILSNYCLSFNIWNSFEIILQIICFIKWLFHLAVKSQTIARDAYFFNQCSFKQNSSSFTSTHLASKHSCSTSVHTSQRNHCLSLYSMFYQVYFDGSVHVFFTGLVWTRCWIYKGTNDGTFYW